MTRTKLGGSSRLGQNIAEERQLLAEEKWIIEILKEIKRHKNSLQIERLHFEHVKAQILTGNTDPSDTKLPTAAESTEELPTEASIQEYTAKLSDRWADKPLDDGLNGIAGLDDIACNNETLNLSMTTSVFANRDLNSFGIEEEEDEEEMDMDNCEIDMNMFMNGG
ncbi:unnamed protein product [Chrysodeixis includens]|uniref:Uncharacterized protein n=1 Tax=Chrysodeixis includens TaxID=689277 RepID=A0A9P0BZ58_CHRIL|nr:unnamed protein product [Chrysodeixis includens]